MNTNPRHPLCVTRPSTVRHALATTHVQSLLCGLPGPRANKGKNA